jgi:hypothetical protein
VTIKPPQALDELVAWAFPDALWITFEPHSDEAFTVNILDLDYTYTVWLATLSLDERWTLSPRGGPWQGKPVVIDFGEDHG